MFAEKPASPIFAAIAGKTARQLPASFSKVCSVAISVDQLADVTTTTCCALPTSASCWTSNGVADGLGVAVGAGGCAVAVGFAVGFGVGVGVGVAAAMSDGGLDAGELATAVLSGATLAGALFGTELAAPVGLVSELTTGLDAAPAEDGWLLVHATKAAKHRTATTERAGVGLVVRSRLAIDARLTRLRSWAVHRLRQPIAVPLSRS